MTIRTFWTILLRILGLYLILQSLSVFSQFIPLLTYFGDYQEPNLLGISVSIIYPILTIGLYFYIMTLIVYKSDWIIDKLKLNNGLEDNIINLNFDSDKVLTIATIVIGALIIADGFPSLCSHIFIYYQQKFSFQDSPTMSWIIYYLIKTIIGYYILTNSKSVIDFINSQRKEAKQDNK